MSNADTILPQLRRLLKAKQCFGPVPEATIVSAERELGVRFPPSYRAFLSNYGAGGAPPPYDLYGLPDTRNTDDEPPLWLHIVDMAKSARAASRGIISPAFVPLSSDGGDYSFYLDTTRVNASGECPVIAMGPGADELVVADEFLQFLRKITAGDHLR
jgi:cell wall assembly regulator SMI1